MSNSIIQYLLYPTIIKNKNTIKMPLFTNNSQVYYKPKGLPAGGLQPFVISVENHVEYNLFLHLLCIFKFINCLYHIN